MFKVIDIPTRYIKDGPFGNQKSLKLGNQWLPLKKLKDIVLNSGYMVGWGKLICSSENRFLIRNKELMLGCNIFCPKHFDLEKYIERKIKNGY